MPKKRQRKTFREIFEQWKAVKRVQRRDKALRLEEEMFRKEREEEESRRIRLRVAEEEARDEVARLRARRESAKAFVEYVARIDAERHREAEEKRAKERIKAAQLASIFSEADLEKIKTFTQPRVETSTVLPVNASSHAEEKDEIALSQEVLRIERQTGMVCAPVKARQRKVEDEVDDRILHLRHSLTEYPRIAPGVHTIKGHRIGKQGAKRLAMQLAKDNGASSLATINLSFNAIQNDGLAALLASSSFSKLTALYLAANHLTHGAVDTITASRNLASRLKVLDLRHNTLNDQGAYKLASAVLAGKFLALTDLVLCHNDIRKQGVTALYQAFTAEALPTLCPAIRKVNVRYNKASMQSKCPPSLFVC